MTAISDKRPLCKLCKERHWLSEPHRNVTVAIPEPTVTLYKPLSIEVTLPPRCTDCDERVVEITRLHKEIAKLKTQNAARQKAYRKRHP